ncbi:unnamed protein product [Adineta steineri]|uniref:Phosphoglycerate mutase-like protein n=1 Tax=Adineta steineri TaxID=433720 RepID=A0A813NEV0_9BILA|nr:unnamed protein product [Adineta steineri]CAF3591348.1 unnamed protein product [Adineta steineri]
MILVIVIVIVIVILIFLWFLSQHSIVDLFCSIIVRRSKRYRCRHRPKRIILVRHGESQGNQDTSIYSHVPDHAIGLTGTGQEQARHCGEELKKLIGPDETIICFVSPFRRSKETCDLICQAFSQDNILKIREDPRIREQEWGNFQDLASRETTIMERKKIGRFFYRFRNGESGADVYDRVSSFINSLNREMDNCLKPNNNIIIVSHGLFMRLFLMRFYRWSVEKFHTLENFDNCGYCILERGDNDGNFVLKTDLNTYPERKPTLSNSLEETFVKQSFHEEVNPSIHTEDIGQTKKTE